MGNPLEDERLMRDVIGELHDYVTKQADERESAADKRHQELIRIHRDGWKQMADAIVKAGELIAGALRSR